MGYSSISIGDSKTTPPTKESKMTHLDMIQTRQASVAKALEVLEGMVETHISECDVLGSYTPLVEAVRALKRAGDVYRAAAEYEGRPHAALEAIHRHGHRAES